VFVNLYSSCTYKSEWVIVVLDQHDWLDFYSASSLKQHSKPTIYRTRACIRQPLVAPNQQQVVRIRRWWSVQRQHFLGLFLLLIVAIQTSVYMANFVHRRDMWHDISSTNTITSPPVNFCTQQSLYFSSFLR